MQWLCLRPRASRFDGRESCARSIRKFLSNLHWLLSPWAATDGGKWRHFRMSICCSSRSGSRRKSMRRLPARRTLFLAALLHDIGKGKKRSHTHERPLHGMYCIVPESMQRMGPRNSGETVVWYGGMTICISVTNRPFAAIYEEALQTIRDFVASEWLLPSGCRLRLAAHRRPIYRLCSPTSNAWNAWKAALLADDLFNGCGQRNLIASQTTYLQNSEKTHPITPAEVPAFE